MLLEVFVLILHLKTVVNGEPHNKFKSAKIRISAIMRKESSKLCICQICNCGRHKCPHQRRKIDSCKPPHRGVQAEGPMSSNTTHRTDFVEHPLVHQGNCKREAEYQPPQGTFNGLTTYTKEYTGRPGQSAVPIKPVNRKGTTAKFNAEATYTTDYRAWKIDKRESPVCRESNWSKPNIPFTGTPTYTCDYVAYDSRPPTSCKPIHQYIENQTPFADSTDYRDSYRTPDVPERARPIKITGEIHRASVPMEHISTHMQDYYWKTVVPSTSCKPEHIGITHNEPFQQDTTHRSDYKNWEVTERSTPIMANTPSTYPEPLGQMSSDTTYNKDYIPFKVQYHKAVGKADKLGHGIKLPPFQGISDYTDNYRRWTLEPHVKSMARESTYSIPNVKFEGKSTTSDHYVAHLNYRPVESCKPHGQVVTNQTPFDDATLYRMEYTPKHLEPCPAALLNSDLSKYVYAEQSDTGHIFYRRASNSSLVTTAQPPENHLMTLPNAPLTVAN
ncbi:unnamed protein product [Heterobilharzia americana]|nr:unnamed protein product [Heterobilharzia americana]